MKPNRLSDYRPAAPAMTSWWLDLADRTAFQERLKAEAERMAGSTLGNTNLHTLGPDEHKPAKKPPTL